MTDFKQPPRQYNADGELRKVGYEIEYAGVDLRLSAECVQSVTGGKLEQENPYRYVVSGTEFGEFGIEVDASILQEQSYENFLQKIGIDIDSLDIRAPLEDFIRNSAANIVPNEIVTPPIPLDRMSILDDIRTVLVNEQAHGTRGSLIYGFGVHMNPELPSTDAADLLAWLRAYSLLHDWLSQRADVDWTRRISPYINPYPAEYLTLITDPDYAPDRKQLIADYVRLIPSRNHALDMLPAFVHIAGESLLGKLKEPHLIKPRPAFHYRLPNCLLDDPDWRLAKEWNDWVTVETLADNTESLIELCKAYRKHDASWWQRLTKDWVKIAAQYVQTD